MVTCCAVLCRAWTSSLLTVTRTSRSAWMLSGTSRQVWCWHNLKRQLDSMCLSQLPKVSRSAK